MNYPAACSNVFSASCCSAVLACARSAMEADFRAEMTTRLMGEVSTAIEAATADYSANPGTPQTAANTSLQAISS